jgi:acyl carrier protein phosphodiesterase
MNFLAHLYLADGSDEGLLGALMGDFVKGPLVDAYPPGILRGIALHRRIDVFTDSHPVVLRSKQRVSGQRRRFAGIMVDMFYDHFLARDWDDFYDEPLDDFTCRAYRLLAEHAEVLPERLRRIVPAMAHTDWLGSYARVESIRTALDRMARRLKHENTLPGSADELEGRYPEFEQDFRAFLPEVRRFALGQTADDLAPRARHS